jgi:tetratricopeptide (TPR) repeat protein
MWRGSPCTRHAIIPRELIYWTELPKTPADLADKFKRDEAALRLDIAEERDNGAAWYYLGSTLQAVGRHDEAIDAFREAKRCSENAGHAEGAAWAAFKAGESYAALEKWDRVIDCCVAGMADDAGIAELPWLAAHANLRAGRWEQARCFAMLAKAHALGSEAERRRVGFREVRALTVGPDEIIAFARERMAEVPCFRCSVCVDKGCDQCADWAT